MKKNYLQTSLCFALLSLIAIPLVFADTPKKGSEIASLATQWLQSIDQGQYEQSWEDTDELFKKKMDKETWMKAIKAFRNKLGKLKSRSLSTMVYHDPDEKYPNLMCTLYFKSVYEHRTIPHETILAVYDNKQWQIAGYYTD